MFLDALLRILHKKYRQEKKQYYEFSYVMTLLQLVQFNIILLDKL